MSSQPQCSESRSCEPGGKIYKMLHGNGEIGMATRIEIIDHRLKRVEVVLYAILAIAGMALLNELLSARHPAQQQQQSVVVPDEERSDSYYMSAEEVAEKHLGVTRDTLYRMIRDGRVDAESLAEPREHKRQPYRFIRARVEAVYPRMREREDGQDDT